MFITRLLFGVILSAVVSLAHAEEYRLLVPFPPGNLADGVARAIQASIERNSKDRLVITNMPGAQTILGANTFVSNRNYDIISASVSQLVWNPLTKDEVKYKNSDFKPVIMVGSSTALWVTRAETKIYTPQDLVRHFPDIVGGFTIAYDVNVEVINRRFNKKSTVVNFKGTNEVVQALMGGQLDLALITPSSLLMQNVKAGKLRIVGTTGLEDAVLEDIRIPSVSRALGIQSYTGVTIYLTHADADDARTQRLRTLLWNAMQDPAVKRTLDIFYISPDASNDPVQIQNWIRSTENRAREFLKTPLSINK